MHGSWWFYGRLWQNAKCHTLKHANVHFFCNDIFDACYSRWHCHCHWTLQICISFQIKNYFLVHRWRSKMHIWNEFSGLLDIWLHHFFGHSSIFVRKAHISRAHQSNNRWWLIVEIQFVDIVFQFPLEIPIWWRSDQMIISILLIHLFVCLAFLYDLLMW